MSVCKTLVSVLVASAIVGAGSAVAGPKVDVTFKNLSSEKVVYTIVTNNEMSTSLNAKPKPRDVESLESDVYSVQSMLSPDVNSAMVRYVSGRKSCAFGTTFVFTFGAGGFKVPQWNKHATPSGGAVCTAVITSFNAATYAWAVEFTMK